LHGQSVFQKTTDYYSLQLPDETMRYVHRILAFKLLIGNPDKYGFHIDKDETYEPVATRAVPVKSTIPSLADFARTMGTTYKKLKELNPWLREERLTVKNGKSYEIELPAT
jgi:membrane-bound lytic murein transglycosylase D